MAFVTESESREIQAAVERAEARSSGEIVPVIVGSSSSYDWIGYRGAFLGWLLASLLGLFAHLWRPFLLEFWEMQAFQLLGLALGWGLSRTRPGFRLFVSREDVEEEVREAAHVSFVRNGLMETRERNGVLVFVSLRERRVVVLGDRGIHEKVGEGFWKEEVARLTRSIRAGRAGAGMVEVIDSIGARLAAHFPPRADDRNELADSLRNE